MRRQSIVPALMLLACLWGSPATAQWEVTDSANIAQQSTTARIKETILAVNAKTNQVLSVMSRRLHQLQDMRQYAIAKAIGWLDVPLSYIETPLGLASDFMRVLQTGELLVDSIREFDLDPRHLDRGPLESAMVSLDLAGSVLNSGMSTAGRIRGNGRSEDEGIAKLERDVTGQGSGSATEALDTLTGAALVRARQNESRMQLATVLVETMLVENTRERQTEASAMRMRMGLLEYHGRPLDSTEDRQTAATALRTWRQP